MFSAAHRPGRACLVHPRSFPYLPRRKHRVLLNTAALCILPWQGGGRRETFAHLALWLSGPHDLSTNVGLPASSPPAQWGLLEAVPLAGPRAGPLWNIAQQDPYRLLPSCPLMRGPWGEGVYYLGGGLLEMTVAMRTALKMGSHVTSDPHDLAAAALEPSQPRVLLGALSSCADAFLRNLIL